MEKIYECIEVLFKYNKYKIIPSEILEQKYKNYGLDEICKHSNVIYRKIRLFREWYKNDFSNLVLINKESNIAEIVCVRKFNKYYFVNSGKLHPINKLDLQKYESAYVFYYNLNHDKLEKYGRKYFYIYCTKFLKKTKLIKLTFFNFIELIMSLCLPILYFYIFSIIDLSKTSTYFLLIGLFMLNISCIWGISSLVKNLIIQDIANSLELNTFIPMIDLLFDLTLETYSIHDDSEIIKRDIYISEWVRSFITNGTVFILNAINAIIFLIIFIIYDRVLFYISILLSLIYFGILYLLGKKQYKYDGHIFEFKSSITSKLYQAFIGIECIKSNRIEGKIYEDIRILFYKMKKSESKKRIITGVFETTNTLLISIFSILFLYIINRYNFFTVEKYMSFDCLFSLFLIQIFYIVKSVSNCYEWKPIVKRSEFLFSTHKDENKEGLIKNIMGKINFDSVSYSYLNKKVILDNVSFEILPGDFIGIVGETGAGKSTIINMILGFIQPQLGEIRIDDISLNQMDISYLRKKIGVVLQNDHLVAGSIYDNIVIMADNNSNSYQIEKKVEELINIVSLDKEIEKMPMGMRTILTESKDIISGGQVQKILIARALFNDPSILILDESTSALDYKTQEKILKNIDNKKITRILVSHTIESFKYCNKIIRLTNGKKEDIGTYNQLRDIYKETI